jgi:hypothetical protein
VPVRNIGTMLGRPAREQQLFTQSVPILAGHTEQTPKPLPLVTATVYGKSFGNFAFHCDRQKPIP